MGIVFQGSQQSSHGFLIFPGGRVHWQWLLSYIQTNIPLIMACLANNMELLFFATPKLEWCIWTYQHSCELWLLFLRRHTTALPLVLLYCLHFVLLSYFGPNWLPSKSFFGHLSNIWTKALISHNKHFRLAYKTQDKRNNYSCFLNAVHLAFQERPRVD